jgi:hypothetical protein
MFPTAFFSSGKRAVATGSILMAASWLGVRSTAASSGALAVAGGGGAVEVAGWAEPDFTSATTPAKAATTTTVTAALFLIAGGDFIAKLSPLLERGKIGAEEGQSL